MKNLFKGLTIVGMLLLCSCAKGLHTGKPNIKDEFVSTKRELSIAGLNGVNNRSGVDSAFANGPTPLRNGFAHNDYCHKRPLSEALENGFTNIEADIFLVGDKLIVAHIFPYFKGSRTLEALYLRPLFERITKNANRVFAGYNSPVTLMIDIKTNAEKTYLALKPLLEKYKSILSSCENGEVVYRAVTVVISGHKPTSLIENEQNRLAFIDEDLCSLRAGTGANNLISMASCKYSKLVSWDGNGAFSDIEKSRLCALVVQAHKLGARVRLWASPEKKEVWDELLNCGVDLINADDLVGLKNYLALQPRDGQPNNRLNPNYTRLELPGIHK